MVWPATSQSRSDSTSPRNIRAGPRAHAKRHRRGKARGSRQITLDTDARAEIARAVEEFPHNCAAPLATEIVLKLEAVGADADRLFRQLAKLTTSEQQVDDNAHFYMLSLGAPRPSQKRRLCECLAPGTRTDFLAGLQTIRDAADLAAAKLTSGGGRSTKVARDQLISTALETYDHAALHKTAARCRNAFVRGVLKLAGAPEMSDAAFRKAVAGVRRRRNE